MNILYKELSYEYLDSLTELDKMCFKVCWSRNLFESELNSNMTHYVIAVCEDLVVGYAGIQYVAGEGNITNIAVHPQYRKKGIASHLICQILEFSKHMDLEFVTLEVRESNINAIRLYTKFGFEVVGLRKNYYSDNNENAVLMTKYKPYTAIV